MNEFCERYAHSKNKQKLNKQKIKVMKIKNAVINLIIAMKQSKWIRPTLVTLALIVAFLGMSGCGHQH